MDYIGFVNSRDIREYLYSLDYKLSGEQKLFITDHSYRLSLDEKIAALEGLLNEPDEDVVIRNHCYMLERERERMLSKTAYVHRSLHQMTRKLIKRYRTLLDIFRKNENDAFYEVNEYEFGNKRKCSRFRDYERVMSFFQERYLNKKYQEDFDDADSFGVEVVKQYFDAESNFASADCEEKYISAVFDKEFNIYSLYENMVLSDDFSDEDTTDGIMIYLPMPFKRGDILVNSSLDPEYVIVKNGFDYLYKKGDPFVVSDFNPDENLSRGVDSSDIICCCHYLNKFSTLALASEVNIHPYDLEYYRGEISGKYKILKALSAHLKDSSAFDGIDMMRATRYSQAFAEFEEVKKELNCHPVIQYLFLDKHEQEKFRREHLAWELKNAPDEILSLTESVRIWLDDERDAPSGYLHCHSVNETIEKIRECERHCVFVEELNLDHDLGDYASDGGDAIRLLDFLVQRETFYKVVLHTANPVGRANMQRTIDRYWPKEPIAN